MDIEVKIIALLILRTDKLKYFVHARRNKKSNTYTCDFTDYRNLKKFVKKVKQLKVPAENKISIPFRNYL